MPHNKIRLTAVTLALVAAILACNFPTRGSSTPFAFATPNQTMTALFGALTPPATSGTAPAPTATGAAVSPTLPAGMTPSAAQATAGGVARPGPTVQASYLSTPPAIDGNWSEWTTPAYPAAFVVFGASRWTDANDLEGSFRAGWDNDYLYLAVKVKDDTYVQEARGQDLYQGDSVEVLFDANLAGDYTTAQLDKDDYQLGLSPGYMEVGQEPEAYLWYPTDLAGPRPQVRVAAIRTTGVTRLEAAIPWQIFGVTPTAGAEYGFVLSVSDNDTPGTSEQETLASNDSHRALTDPTTWGKLVLKR